VTLRQRIIDEIEGDGPMPFERFMELSLYDADGFFGGDRLRSEKSGDFLTSPEVSALFGETIAGYVSKVRSEIGEPFQLIEVGAGSGSLLRPILDAIDVPALAVETSPAAREALAGLVPVTDTLPPRIRGVVVANELVDNLPMALANAPMVRGESGGSVSTDMLSHSWTHDRDPRCSTGSMPTGRRRRRRLGRGPARGEVLACRRHRPHAVSAIVLFDYGDTAENLCRDARMGPSGPIGRTTWAHIRWMSREKPISLRT
jgi:hypothetical protein